jgi:hypothetical protein
MLDCHEIKKDIDFFPPETCRLSAVIQQTKQEKNLKNKHLKSIEQF